jgi:hypothetical protein
MRIVGVARRNCKSCATQARCGTFLGRFWGVGAQNGTDGKQLSFWSAQVHLKVHPLASHTDSFSFGGLSCPLQTRPRVKGERARA